jgi:acyl carrier protein
MASESAIAERIRTALGEHLRRDPASIEPRHALREDLGLDSMATSEMLFKIEETFDLQIPNRDLHHLTTVADVIEYVEGRIDRPAPAAAKAAGKPAAAKRASVKKSSAARRSPRKKG